MAAVDSQLTAMHVPNHSTASARQESMFRRPGAFSPELSPSWLNAVSIINGHGAIDLSRPFSIVDVRCRSAINAVVAAAAFPTATVHACESDPTYLELADELIRASGLDNIRLHENRRGLKLSKAVRSQPHDVIWLNDIITTVDAVAKSSVLDFAAQHVRHGGMAAISYRALAGWAEIITLQRLARTMLSHRAAHGESDAVAAIRFLDELRQTAAGYFAGRSRVHHALDDLLDADPDTVAYALLTDFLEPMSPGALAAELQRRHCLFVGSSSLSDQLGLEIPEPLRLFIDDVLDVPLRETLRDLSSARMYRCDLYRRGARRYRSEIQTERLLDLEITLMPLLHDPIDHDEAISDARIPPRWKERIASAVSTLWAGPSTLRNCGPEFTKLGSGDLEWLLRYLLGTGLAHPTSGLAPSTELMSRCESVSNALVSVMGPPAARLVVSPFTGTAVSVNHRGPVDAGADGDDVEPRLVQLFANLGIALDTTEPGALA